MLWRRGCYGVVGVFQTKKSERKREDTEVLVKERQSVMSVTRIVAVYSPQ